VVAALPPQAPVPRLLWTYDEGGWVALGLTDIDGHTPVQPWQSHELDLVTEGLQRLHAVLTPSPLASATAADAFASGINGWSELQSTQATGLDAWSMKNLDRLVALEASAPSILTGETLLNFDVRADNILIADDQAYFVDWPWARVGPPYVDWLALAPSVHMQGGPRPDALLRNAPLSDVRDEAINAALASITGYFLGHSRRPPPPGIPTVRAFQQAQGEVALAWLRERLGWP
jgi:hypothetical protein